MRNAIRTAIKRLVRTAHELAEAVRAQESAELARLVADTGEARPTDVGFRQPALLYWRRDGGRRCGSLSEIRGYYQELGQGRLVVVGPARSGKTVLAIRLVRDLATASLAVVPLTVVDGVSA
jgi:ATP-dependent protease Clp ATPase subunit